MTGLWRSGDFVRLWVGRTMSQFGSGLGALAFVAVLMLGASPLQMGLLGAVGVAPGVMFGLGAGVWADRMRRRPILVIASIARALSLASIPAAFALDVLLMEQLYVVAFFNGVCQTFFNVSFGAYLPKMVGRGNLVEANSKLAASGSVVETSAASVGGWITQLATALATVVTGAFSFLVSALFFLAIRKPESAVLSTDERRSTPREVWEGLAFVFVHPVLRALAGSAIAEGLLHGGVAAVILIYGVRLRQAVTPDRVLGRATASIQFVGIGVYLVGLILGGALAEIAGLRPTLIVAGGCGVLGAVWLFFSPVWKMRELPRAER